MKLLVNTAEAIKGEVIQESSSNKEKTYYIKGIFSTIGAKNANGRIYPREIWEKAVADYQKHIEQPTQQSLMEYDHPSDRTYVDPLKGIARITELYIEGDYVMGKAKLLDNEAGNQLKKVIDEGISIGVSSRGTGEVMNGIVTEFELITYDIVPNPSDFNALTQGVNESFDNGVVRGKEYEYKAGRLVECINKENNVLSQFKQLFNKLQ